MNSTATIGHGTTSNRGSAAPDRAGPLALTAATARATGGERPVFHDASGRRARRMRWLGRGVAVLMPAWLVAVLVGALTPLPLPALPVSVATANHPVMAPGVGRGAVTVAAAPGARSGGAGDRTARTGASRSPATIEVASVRGRDGALHRRVVDRDGTPVHRS